MDNNHPKEQVRKGRGILLIALYVALEAVLLGGACAGWDNPCRIYLYNLAIMLTPLAFVYINSTCFNGTWPKAWSGRQWAVAAILWFAAVLLLTWEMEQL